MDSPAVSSRLFSTTLTSRTPQENHIVSVPCQTIEKNKKCFFLIFLVSPGHLGTIQNLIPGCMTIVKLIKQVKNWQSPSRDPWSNCLINSRETTKGQINYYSGRQKDNSKTICRRAGYSMPCTQNENGTENTVETPDKQNKICTHNKDDDVVCGHTDA